MCRYRGEGERITPRDVKSAWTNLQILMVHSCLCYSFPPKRIEPPSELSPPLSFGILLALFPSHRQLVGPPARGHIVVLHRPRGALFLPREQREFSLPMCVVRHNTRIHSSPLRLRSFVRRRLSLYSHNAAATNDRSARLFHTTQPPRL